MPNSSLTKLRKLRDEAQALLTDDEAAHAEHEASPLRKLTYFLARAYRSFSRNRGQVRAAALAYTTVLGLVPLLAVILGVTTSLLKTENGKDRIAYLVQKFVVHVAAPLQPSADEQKAEVRREEAVNQIMEYVGKVNSGTLTGTGVLIFVFVAISLLSTIEATFNDMWGVSRGRSWLTRTVAYWAALTLGPLFLFAAFSLNVLSQFKPVTDVLEHFGFIKNIVEGFFLPLIILSVAFAALYLLMPNTKVDWRAAFVGGVSAGFLFQLNSLLSVRFTSRVVTYSKIYGSLSMVPLLLIGLYISWLIVLFGGQIAYAFQSRKAYVQEKQTENINQRGREFIALQLMTLIGRRFQLRQSPLSGPELAGLLEAPLKLVTQILAVLSGARLVAEVAGKERAYVPNGPLDQITADDILQAMRTGHGQNWVTCNPTDPDAVRSAYANIEQAEKAVAQTLTLQELASKTPQRPS